MKTIDELKSIAATVRDATEDKENTALRVGQLLVDMIDTLSNLSGESIKGYVSIDSTSELPEDPSASEQMIGYICGTTLYLYVGEGGDTLDGKYQSENLQGPQGQQGPAGADGHDGVDLGQVALVNNLEEGGEEAALTAEMGKKLKCLIDNLKVGIVNEEVADIPVEIIDPDIVVFNDPVAESIALENWDTNHDGKISLEEAAAVTGFSTLFKGKNIITTEWMQYFPNVTSLATQSFQQCMSLATVVIPGNIKTINTFAFNANTACTSLVLQEGVESIKNTAFQNNAFTSIVIPSTVTLIEYNAFNMSSLTTVICLATTPPASNSTSYKIFKTNGTITAIYVPAASVDAYKQNQYWSPWASVIQAIPTT